MSDEATKIACPNCKTEIGFQYTAKAEMIALEWLDRLETSGLYSQRHNARTLKAILTKNAAQYGIPSRLTPQDKAVASSCVPPTPDDWVGSRHINRNRLLQMLDNFSGGMYQAISPETVAEAARQLRNSTPNPEAIAARRGELS